MHLVVTTCTNRKRYEHCPDLSARSLPRGNLKDVSGEWRARVSAASPVATAGTLYCGRSFSEASAAAGEIGAQLCIVSAGLGFLAAQQPVPSYNLTVSGGATDCVLNRVTPPNTAADWWGELVDCDVVSEKFRSTSGLILVAVSASYLNMIAPILKNLQQSIVDRLRIFVRPGISMLPDCLLAQTLLYDDRLDGPWSPIRGTKADFLSRAVHHFAKAVMDQQPTASVADQAKLIDILSSKWGYPSVRSGARHPDSEIRELLHQHWDRTGGLSTRLLRVLRDELAVACEQKRFKRLALEVRNERVPS